MACWRLVTLAPELLLSLPEPNSRITFDTFFWAARFAGDECDFRAGAMNAACYASSECVFGP